MFVESIDNNSISNHLKQLTKEPHVAGSPENFKTAKYVESTFKDCGLDAHHKHFDVLLTYPLHRSLVLTQPGHEPIKLFLNERAVPGDPFTNNSKVLRPFHGYAPSGNTSAEAVYANYGRQEDFEKLFQLGVTVEGAIVIARYGMIFRGDIVENAALAGAVAVVIYSDSFDYGNNGTQGYYPDSQWLPPSGAQRGSVYRGIGDPLTPGWASESDAERLSVDDPATILPRIPSLPISAEDALPILRSLSGPVAPVEWQGTLELSEYKLGSGPGRLDFSYVVK
jgi:N-acetylated-alpha-linked acidic dipeptidase